LAGSGNPDLERSRREVCRAHVVGGKIADGPDTIAIQTHKRSEEAFLARKRLNFLEAY